jgi:glycosyltransferase involved in cell wall biosynthesis
MANPYTDSANFLFIINDPIFFISHRLPLAVAAKKAGYKVFVATGAGENQSAITDAGFEYLQLPLTRGGMNPFSELRLLWAIAAVYRLVRPDLVHLVTIKPVLYGGLLARLLRVPAMVAAISGMGYLFASERRSLARRLAECLYRVALGHPRSRVIVQNTADREALFRIGALKHDHDMLIPGSGVDLDAFTSTPMPEAMPLVVLPARMLWDKGVGEFVEAAHILSQRNISVQMALVGPYDPHNPRAVPLAQLEDWRANGPVEWWRRRDDMPKVLASASIVALPSYYREGVPKALLEAAASGRAIVTTDAPGCRDVVEPGKNGLLVPARDAVALADAIQELLADHERLVEMGRYSRQKAVAEFGIERVVDLHMQIYRELSGLSSPGIEIPERRRN